jgi:endogenous inhibitor of DNA gyrase (YacG/DUF329 family)
MITLSPEGKDRLEKQPIGELEPFCAPKCNLYELKGEMEA